MVCNVGQTTRVPTRINDQELYLLRMVWLVGCLLTAARSRAAWSSRMNGLIYLIGLIVVIMAVLSLLGLR
jgi:hypothetical protein